MSENQQENAGIPISLEEKNAIERSQFLRDRLQNSTSSGDVSSFSFMPFSREEIRDRMKEGTSHQIIENIFQTHEQIAEILRKPQDRLDELHRKVEEIMILKGELPSTEVSPDHPEVMRYREATGDGIRAFDLVFDGKNTAEIEQNMTKIGISDPKEMALVFMAAKNPKGLSEQETQRAYGSALAMIPALSAEIQQLDKRIADGWFPGPREANKDRAVKLGFFLSKAILARDNLARENANISPVSSRFDERSASQLAIGVSEKQSAKKAEKIYEQKISAVRIPENGEKVTENAAIRKKIGEEKELLQKNPDAIANMGIPFFTALQKLQSGFPADQLLPEEVKAILNVSTENTEWNLNKIQAQLQKWEKNEEKGIKGIAFDAYYESGFNRDFRFAIRYAAALELGKDALALAGGAEKFGKIAEGKRISPKGAGAYIDPNQDNINYKNVGNLAGRVFTPGGLAAYYVGMYGGAMTLLLNLVSCVQSREWDNPYLAAGAAMLYGGKSYLDGKIDLPASGKGKPFQLVREITMNENNRFDILRIFADPKEMAVFEKIDLTQNGQNALKNYKNQKKGQIKQEKESGEKEKGKKATEGTDWHRERGAIFSADKIELAPKAMLSDEFSGVFPQGTPTELIGKLPDNPKANTARMEAIEYLFKKSITPAELSSVQKHAVGVLQAHELPLSARP